MPSLIRARSMRQTTRVRCCDEQHSTCVSGLLLAAGMVASQSAAPIMHLRDLNPHVGSALEDGKRGGTAALAPRQLRASALAAAQAVAGTSSFGMSGVNAHAVLAAPTEHREQNMVRLAGYACRLMTWLHADRLACSYAIADTATTLQAH